MFIFNALGVKSVPFLKIIVPHILNTVKLCGQPGLREALLQNVSNLSAIVKEHLRPYLPEIFEVVEQFWDTKHLAALVSFSTAPGRPSSSLMPFMLNLNPRSVLQSNESLAPSPTTSRHLCPFWFV